MSTTQKISVRDLKIDISTQIDLLAASVITMVGKAGTVDVAENLEIGIKIRSTHAISANSRYAAIRVRFHGANADVGIYVEKDGSISMAWDGYVVQGNEELRQMFEGRTDRVTFEKNLKAMFIAKTFEQSALENGMFSHGVKRTTLADGLTGQFEVELDVGTLGGFGKTNDKKQSLTGTFGGAF